MDSLVVTYGFISSDGMDSLVVTYGFISSDVWIR